MLLEWPCCAGDRVLEFDAPAHFVDREVVTADNPACLAHPRQTISAHACGAKRLGEFGLQKTQGAVGLLFALDPLPGRSEWIERVLDVRHVDDGGPSSRQVHGKTVTARQS